MRVEIIEVPVRIEIMYDETRNGSRQHVVNRIPQELCLNLFGGCEDFGVYEMKLLKDAWELSNVQFRDGGEIAGKTGSIRSRNRSHGRNAAYWREAG